MHEIFCGTGFYKRREEKMQREEKYDFFAFSLLRGKHRLQH